MDNRKNSCINCTKRKNSLFRDLSNDELRSLDKNKYSVFYRSGEIICKEGSKPLGLICLNKGKVKIVRRGVNGTNQIIGLKKSVDFIGFRDLMRENSCLASSVALEDSDICIIKKKDFFKVIEGNNNLAFKIMKLLAQDLVKSDGRLVNLTQKHVRARLAEALLLINDIYGANTITGILNIRLKRADLAGLSNMTTPNAIRVLSSFNKENLVDVKNQKIKITNLKVMKEISAFDR
jgi:CRP-like cAMP-binding protein